jgi:hypothetical protein
MSAPAEFRCDRYVGIHVTAVGHRVNNDSRHPHAPTTEARSPKISRIRRRFSQPVGRGSGVVTATVSHVVGERRSAICRIEGNRSACAITAARRYLSSDGASAKARDFRAPGNGRTRRKLLLAGRYGARSSGGPMLRCAERFSGADAVSLAGYRRRHRRLCASVMDSTTWRQPPQSRVPTQVRWQSSTSKR